MSRSSSPSRALSIVRRILRILIVTNWVVGVPLLLVVIAAPRQHWILSAFQISASPEADQLILGLRTLSVVGLAEIPLTYIVLKRLLAIVESVGAGDPFIAANAQRLQTTAKAMLALQILGVVEGIIAKAASFDCNQLHVDDGLSLGGWIAVLFTFVLARVFAEGARMRDDLEGTV